MIKTFANLDEDLYYCFDTSEPKLHIYDYTSQSLLFSYLRVMRPILCTVPVFLVKLLYLTVFR